MPEGTFTDHDLYEPARYQSTAAGDSQWADRVNANFTALNEHFDYDGLLADPAGHHNGHFAREMPMPWVVVDGKMGDASWPGHLDRPTDGIVTALTLLPANIAGAKTGTLLFVGGKLFDASVASSGWSADLDVKFEVLHDSVDINGMGLRVYVMGGGLGQGAGGAANLTASYVFVTASDFPDDGRNVIGFGGSDIYAEGLIVKMEGVTDCVGFEYKDPGGFGGKNFKLNRCIANLGSVGFRLGTYSNDNSWLIDCTASFNTNYGFQCRRGTTASNNIHFQGCTTYWCGTTVGGVSLNSGQGAGMRFEGSTTDIEPNAVSIYGCRFFGAAPAISSTGGHSITVHGQCQFELDSVGTDGRAVSDAAMTNGSSTITSATAAFVTGDVGKTLVIEKADGTYFNFGTVSSRTNATTIVASFTNTSGGDLTGAILYISPVKDRPTIVLTNSASGSGEDTYTYDFIIEDGYFHQIPQTAAWTSGVPTFLDADHTERLVVRPGVQIMGEIERLSTSNRLVRLANTSKRCTLDLSSVYYHARGTKVTDPTLLFQDAGIGNEVTFLSRQGTLQTSRRGRYTKPSATGPITSDNTPNSDPDLYFDAVSNAIYQVELTLLVTGANTTMDFLAQWSLPSGAAVKWQLNGLAGGVATGTTATAVSTTSLAAGTAAGGAFMLKLTGIILMSSTEGQCIFQWSQNTSDGGNLTLEATSNLLYERLNP